MKKILTTFLAVMVTVLGYAQTAAYHLHIDLSAVKAPATAYLVTSYGWSNQRTLDSADAASGHVTFNGETTDPEEVSLIITHAPHKANDYGQNADALTLYLEKGDISVKGTDSVKYATVTGSKTTDSYRDYYALVIAPGKKFGDRLNQIYRSASPARRKDPAFMDTLKHEMQVEFKRQDSLKYIFIQTHPGSYVSVELLTKLAGDHPDITRIKPLFKSLTAEMRNTEAGKKLGYLLYDNGPTAIGAIAPDFTEPDLNGKPVSLSDFRGKYVLLDFWASWCGPCRAENPNVVRAYQKYKNKNFTVLSVSLDQPGKKQAWADAVKKDGLAWTQVSDLQFWNNKAAILYNIRFIPQNFLIDPSGKIIAKNLRGDDLEVELSKIFN